MPELFWTLGNSVCEHTVFKCPMCRSDIDSHTGLLEVTATSEGRSSTDNSGRQGDRNRGGGGTGTGGMRRSNVSWFNELFRGGGVSSGVSTTYPHPYPVLAVTHPSPVRTPPSTVRTVAGIPSTTGSTVTVTVTPTNTATTTGTGSSTGTGTGTGTGSIAASIYATTPSSSSSSTLGAVERDNEAERARERERERVRGNAASNHISQNQGQNQGRGSTPSSSTSTSSASSTSLNQGTMRSLRYRWPFTSPPVMRG